MAHKKTQNWRWTLAAQDAMLTSLGAATATFTLVGAKLKTALNAPEDQGRNQILGDFTESTFTGYAEITLGAIGAGTPTVNGPLILNANQTGLNASCSFISTANQDPAGEQIMAVFLTNPAEDALWGYEILEEPVPVELDGQFLQYDFTPGMNTTFNVPA